MFVAVCDYGSATTGANPDDLLQGAKQGAIDNVKRASSQQQTRVTLGIYPGLPYEAENDTGSISPVRIYLVGTTLYQTLVVVPLGKPYADTARFLDSFQLIARTAP